MKCCKRFLPFVLSTMLCLFIGLYAACNAIAAESSQVLAENDIEAAIERAEPLIEEITGLDFKEKMKFSMVSRLDFEKRMASDFYPMLKGLMEGADDETVSRQAEMNAQHIGQYALGEYFRDKKELLIIPVNLSSQMELYGIENEELNDFFFLYTAHHMVNVLDNQHFPEDEEKAEAISEDQEKAEVARALRQGHAVYVVKQIADKLEIDETVYDAALKSFARITSSTDPMQQQKLNLIFLKSSEFFEKIVAAKGPSEVGKLFASADVSMRQIMNPGAYLSPAEIKAYDCEKLMGEIVKKLPSEGMQSQSVKVGSAALGNILVSQGAPQQDANSIALECLGGSVYSAAKPGEQPCMVVATVLQFTTAEALSNYVDLTRKIIESTRSQLGAMPNVNVNVVKDQEVALDGYEYAKYQHVDTTVDEQVTSAYSADATTDTFYFNVLYVNPETEQDEETISDLLKFMNKERLKLM